MTDRRVMYVQYTDPAGYPPLEHSAHMLADAGWRVLFAGIESFGVGFKMSEHESIAMVRVSGRSGGAHGALKYALFAVATAVIARRFKPAWIYASDALSAPATLLARKVTGARVIYHEHDIPVPPANARNRAVMRAREKLIATADLLVVPAEGRKRALGPDGDSAKVVWNCPLPEEVTESVPAARDRITLVYAGSITRERLPASMIQALALLPPSVHLRIIGYQTVGAPNYVDELLAAARAAGVADRVMYAGAFERRVLMENELNACDIGIATAHTAGTDENMQTMAGASNKAFDYMARGLPILVTDDPAWRRMYVDPGFGVACNPLDPASIAAALTPLLDAARRAEMGERARRRIRDDWNYVRQFAPVFQAMGS